MSSTLFVPANSIRQRLKVFIENITVQRILLAFILVNAVILGLETSSDIMAAVGPFLIALDKVILAVFVVELTIRLFVHRLAFFKDGWNVFDFIVVGIALVPASGPFAVLRSLRVLRVLRVLTFVPSMKKIVGALIKSLNGMLSIAMVLGLVYYVAAVMVTKLFGEAFPEWFGSLGASLYTLFQVMTLESWSMGIARPVMEAFPYAWAFFIPFILIATFTMLNLFIAVIVNAVQTMHDDEHKDEMDEEKATQKQLMEQMQQLQQELQALRRDMNKS
ncbi:voltage-gated sodium channel [Marinomonas alcarazii]|uniref:Voltage-gated sodium channel n=1 Tax=Marinomonas alcarazii TaxID=491949 RepID=A0A318UR79_9GAMM|nr:ion transporter [Marinomonas alcarazii]PYF78944.1 voltage-gated sodium channel [Marinomonas alcarazii]